MSSRVEEIATQAAAAVDLGGIEVAVAQHVRCYAERIPERLFSAQSRKGN